MSTLVSDIITQALKLNNVIGAGETPNNEESADMLFALNAMLALWNTQQFAVYVIVNQQFLLTVNKGSYTIGSGGDFNATRPEKITSANIVLSGVSLDVKVVDHDEWSRIEERGLTGARTMKLYNDNAYPLSHLQLWPIPSQPNYLELFMWQQLQQFTSLSDTFDFPPGYALAIIYNLAVATAMSFGREPSPTTVGLAREYKGALGMLNEANDMGIQPAQIPPAPPQPQQ